ncbi:DUF4190 domain-containing protein [Blastococcus haudaquaticus]|uniref:DUF4190 domain-containing protein n=1 Tax=Blastococcus haudaquaticus TaxID=1938745 RepID=A0A286H100_9ACTN|nr:DUF4190 domain-containing protein [Blastococcus haudaquaticus]SOE01445.1 protein of unknown function [Blastococcus haudaquaticus]
MSSNDENLYRGDPPSPPPPPPAGAPPAGYGQPAPGYGPPAYGPPGYGQPGFPPPAYGPPPGYPPVYGRPTNTMAILALVMAFVFAPAGLVLGIVARRQIRQTGEDGEGLALAGIIVGGIVTAIFVGMIVLWLVAFAAFSSNGFS